MSNIKKFKDFSPLNENFFKKENISKWLNNIKDFSKREALETKIASKIFRKIVKKNLKLSDEKISEEEITFLKNHTKDLVKTLGFIATSPTPIPYVWISFALKKAGIDLFPSKEDLEIPDSFKDFKDKDISDDNIS